MLDKRLELEVMKLQQQLTELQCPLILSDIIEELFTFLTQSSQQRQKLLHWLIELVHPGYVTDKLPPMCHNSVPHYATSTQSHFKNKGEFSFRNVRQQQQGVKNSGEDQRLKMLEFAVRYGLCGANSIEIIAGTASPTDQIHFFRHLLRLCTVDQQSQLIKCSSPIHNYHYINSDHSSHASLPLTQRPANHWRKDCALLDSLASRPHLIKALFTPPMSFLSPVLAEQIKAESKGVHSSCSDLIGRERELRELLQDLSNQLDRVNKLDSLQIASQLLYQKLSIIMRELSHLIDSLGYTYDSLLNNFLTGIDECIHSSRIELTDLGPVMNRLEHYLDRLSSRVGTTTEINTSIDQLCHISKHDCVYKGEGSNVYKTLFQLCSDLEGI